jgi:STE24 endopeptidase
MKRSTISPMLLALGFLFAMLAGSRPSLGSPRVLAYPQAQAPAQNKTQPKQTDVRPEVRPEVRPIEAQQRVTAYTLPPDLYRKAKTLGRIHFTMNLIDIFYGLFAYWLVLQLKWAPKFRDWAERVSKNRFIQAFVFVPVLILVIAAIESPMAIYEHIVSVKYGLSVEGWGALAWDWTKGILVFLPIGSVMTWILYAVIRRSPRNWWFTFWLIAVPIIVFLSFIEPFVLEPIFFKFAPLQQKDASLVTELEKVAMRAGLDIPPERMYWMKASDKTPTMNAYVSGLGASKRIVVWDTTIEKETTPEIVSVIGHEMGHYVLGHVWKGLIFTLAVMFILLWLGYRTIGWMLARWGPEWSVRGLDDWASLPALLLLFAVFSLVFDPISNAYSRHVEHQADQYGLEVTHGILPDAAQTAADSFQVEGESSLAEPDPNPINVFLFYTHPPISNRVQFLLHYDPWSQGKQPEFVK